MTGAHAPEPGASRAALGDVRVLDLTRHFPGPYCTLILGDLGADVVKLEPVAGGDPLRSVPPLRDGMSVMFQALNRNKRSIALDLRSDPGREAALRLAASCDVVVEGFRPGVMEHLGLGYAELRARNPGLVLCRLTGYGQDGPYHERAGHDLDYVAAAGILGLARCGDRPVVPPVQIGDMSAGQSAAIAILAALHERASSGRGQELDVAVLDGLLGWMSMRLAVHLAGAEPGSAAASGEDGGAVSVGLDGRHPCYRVYACADGHLAVAALEPRFWQQLVEALGLPELSGSGLASGEEARRVSERVEAVLRRHTAAEWMTRLAGLDVCVEPVTSLAGALAHPQAVSRGSILPAGLGGALPQVGFPFRLSRTPQRVDRPAPRLGEHTADILEEVGYGGVERAALRERGWILEAER
jgi:alpha-methylacyl-CoA racemase